MGGANIKSRQGLKALQLQRVIGTGAYSVVYLALDKASKTPVALKVMKKSKIVRRGWVQHVNTERLILSMTKNQFIVSFKNSFQTPTSLYYVLEYLPGGELFHYIKSKKTLDMKEIAFYSAEVFCALQYLHSIHCVYRDLKPENVLIAADGHVKLVDFGLSKRLLRHERTKTLCGTPEYIAPEMLSREGHGYEVDWWQLGIFFYDILFGKTPFHNPSPFVLYERIMSHEVDLQGIEDENLKDLVGKLLEKQPERRLNEAGIQSHPFYQDINWTEVEERRLKPPFVPHLKSPSDSSNFNQFDIETQDEDEVCEDLFPEF